MSTASFTALSSMPGISARAIRLPFQRSRPRRYSPWREPISQRQSNTYFEQQILPELSALLESSFEEMSEFDREEAVQDSICQALEVFRVLRLHESTRTSTASNETVLALAKYASSRYLAGIRFAGPRSASCL